jgi:predicted DNA-binding protein
MRKTQIQVEDWQYEAVKKLSARTSRSMAEIMREALSRSLTSSAELPPLSVAAGKFQPLPQDDLKDHDAGWAGSIR